MSPTIHVDHILVSLTIHVDHILVSLTIHIDHILVSPTIHVDHIFVSSNIHIDHILVSPTIHVDHILVSWPIPPCDHKVSQGAEFRGEATGDIRCEVCEVSVNSSHQLQAHMTGEHSILIS